MLDLPHGLAGEIHQGTDSLVAEPALVRGVESAGVLEVFKFSAGVVLHEGSRFRHVKGQVVDAAHERGTALPCPRSLPVCWGADGSRRRRGGRRR